MILFSKYMLAWGSGKKKYGCRLGLGNRTSHLSPNCVPDAELGMYTVLSLLLTAAHEGMTVTLSYYR